MLHIVNKSPFAVAHAGQLPAPGPAGSAVLLIEDGVYAATKGNADAAALHAACGRLQVYALQPDCDARGFTAMLAEGITLVDYGGFVDLVAQRSDHPFLAVTPPRLLPPEPDPEPGEHA